MAKGFFLRKRFFTLSKAKAEAEEKGQGLFDWFTLRRLSKPA
jgi:hypothetical protein